MVVDGVLISVRRALYVIRTVTRRAAAPAFSRLSTNAEGLDVNDDGFVSGDLVERALTAPIEWAKFESLASATLQADDLPSLRQIGGVGDDGVDAVEQAFYDANRKVETVVQVTSAQGQKAKVRDTLKKLAKNGIAPRALIFLTRHPVSATNRTEMIDAADNEGIALDVRDLRYLVGQLTKHPAIFARFFGSARAQIDALLDQPDPLHAASGRLQHALLATLGAYVLSPHARLARGTLFEKTVLAALAARKDGRATRDELALDVKTLLPDEDVGAQQMNAALQRLSASGACTLEGDFVVCPQSTAIQCASVAAAAETGFRRLLQHLVEACKKLGALSDAQQGYLERNLRRAILQLLRVTGPLKDGDGKLDFGPTPSEEIQALLSRDLPGEIGRRALAAFSAFVQDQEQATSLAPLVRSYAALAIRNIDPVGRRWQQTVLARTCVALDTDALLHVIVEELPEHDAILSALRKLHEQGVELLVPEHVLEEAVGHLGRADRTYKRFEDRLLRLPSALVDANVWHAVVRGFYYAVLRGYGGTFESYWAKYNVIDRPREYVEYLLSKRLSLKEARLDEIPPGADDALNELEIAVLEYREQSRRKAVFRDADDMAQRVRADVSMALSLAARSSDGVGSSAKGYIASSDRAFLFIERHLAWRPRQPVHLWTNALPELAYFACGTTLQPDEAVGLLFHPVIIAAADQMGPQISMLASIGVDLKEVAPDRLDWDLRHALKDKLTTLHDAVTAATSDADEASAMATLSLAREAKKQGYQMVSTVATLVDEFDSVKGSLAEERQRREMAEQQLRDLVAAARAQSTTKGKRRINRILGELGISLEAADDAAGEDPPA